MDDMEMHGTPWMPGPVQFNAYREYECGQNTTAECEYYQGYWRFWYEADHRFALPTVAFFTVAILIFALANVFQQYAPQSFQRSPVVRRQKALARFLSYRAFRIQALNWNSGSIGILLLALVGTIFFMCMTLVPAPYYWPLTETLNYWGGSPPLATRSGWLSLGCMPFVFLTAGKSNFITAVTGVSHERLQVFHRWISYAFFITALLHTFPFIVYNIRTHQMVMQWNTNFDYWTGVVALLAQAWLTFASLGPLRTISYEFFKFSHFVAALVFMVFLFFHCGFTLSSWDYFVVTGVFFALSWLHRQLRVYFEHGINNHATVSLAANGFVCVRVPTKATWHVGQHFFVRFMTLGIHAASIHPFTACSLPSETNVESELVFYIRPRGGLTTRLARLAEARPGSTVRVLLDGPYGGVSMPKLEQCQRQLVIAGGSGAGWILPMLLAHIRRNDLVDRAESKEVSNNTMKIILATRDTPTRQWFERTLHEALAERGLSALPSGVEVEVHYTGSGEPGPISESASQEAEVHADPEKALSASHASPDSDSDSDVASNLKPSLKRVDGRPDLAALVRAEVASAPPNEQLGVFVCGPLSMQNDVSNAVAAAQLEIMKGASKEVYLHMEHFSWA
ncbi:hypothetical protein LTR17_001098 [Elasticomyces elasticus]|nr:hypothetical protein LTR17_001098 [Elasticomyces elasticus]